MPGLHYRLDIIQALLRKRCTQLLDGLVAISCWRTGLKDDLVFQSKNSGTSGGSGLGTAGSGFALDGTQPLSRSKGAGAKEEEWHAEAEQDRW